MLRTGQWIGETTLHACDALAADALAADGQGRLMQPRQRAAKVLYTPQPT